MGAAEHRLFLAYLAALLFAGLLTVGQIGITWDEPNYFTSSYSYLSWFGHLVAEPSDWWSSIDRYWEQSHEAPPFLKDRKSTRLNSSHANISYAVFCLKKKKTTNTKLAH